MKFFSILYLLAVAIAGENWNSCDIGREIMSEIGHYKIGNCSNGRFSKSKGELKLFKISNMLQRMIFNILKLFQL